MPTIGNCPAISLPTSIWMPWIEPEKVRPPRPWMPGDARREREHEVGRVVLDAVRPLDADRVDLDRQPARPLEAVARRPSRRSRTTPKPGQRLERRRRRGTRSSCALPPIDSAPAVTCAPIEPKLTSAVVRARAGVEREAVAVSVRNEPSLIDSVSALNLKPVMPLGLNSSVARRPRSSRSRPSGVMSRAGGGDRAGDRLAGQELARRSRRRDQIGPRAAVERTPPSENVTPKFSTPTAGR